MKPPTITSCVEKVLRSEGIEFITMREVCEALPDCNINQVSAALHHLRSRHAADVVIQKGIGYWFGTFEYDNRSATVDFREPEKKPRKPRKSRKVLAEKASGKDN